MMKHNSMKGYKMIATKSFFSWLKIGIPGLLFSFVCIGISIWLLVRNNVPGHSGFRFYYVFADKPWATLLLVISIIFIALFILIANKYALQILVRQVWDNKLADFIIPKIHGYISTLMEDQPDGMKKITGFRFVAACLDNVRQDKTLNKVQQLVLRYGLKGMRLNSSDFEDIHYQLPHAIVTKIEKKIDQSANPSLTSFFLMLIVQIIVLIIALVLT